MSQENNPREQKKESPVVKFLSGKGFYIVLILCLCAIGISGYLFVRNSNQSTAEISDTVEAADAYIPPVEESLQDSDADDYVQPDQAVMAPDVYADASDQQATDVMGGQATLNQQAEQAAEAVADSIVIWPLSGELDKVYSIDALSYSETMADWRIHSGADISADVGTKVMAIMAGTVSQIYEDDFLGTTVVIDHADSVRSLYANLMEVPTVNVGDYVSAGDIVGAVGQTALGEIGQNPHLHLEIYQNGQSIDPIEFLP